MKYISVKNKTITFKDKSVISTPPCLQNSGKEEEKHICGAICCLEHTKCRHAIATSGIWTLYFDCFPLSFCKSRDEESDSPVAVHLPSIPSYTLQRHNSNTLCILPLLGSEIHRFLPFITSSLWQPSYLMSLISHYLQSPP